MREITTEPRSLPVELERGEGTRTEDAFSFPMTLATDGEASDRAILNIKGARYGDSVPLLTSHQNDPTLMLGRVDQMKRRIKEGRLLARGSIDLTDDGTWLAETRRGIATLVENGVLGAVSVRWQPIDGKARWRDELPKDHPAYAASDDPRGQGIYYEEWRVLEGSVVAVGADPQALIGRAEACEREAAGVFFTSLARAAEAAPEADPLLDVGAAFRAVADAVAGLRALGASDADVVNSISGIAGLSAREPDLVPFAFGEGERIFLPRAAWEVAVGESLGRYREALTLAEAARADAARALEPITDSSGTPSDESRSDLEPESPAPETPAPAAPKTLRLDPASIAELGKVQAETISQTLRSFLGKPRGR